MEESKIMFFITIMNKSHIVKFALKHDLMLSDYEVEEVYNLIKREAKAIAKNPSCLIDLTKKYHNVKYTLLAHILVEQLLNS